MDPELEALHRRMVAYTYDYLEEAMFMTWTELNSVEQTDSCSWEEYALGWVLTRTPDQNSLSLADTEPSTAISDHRIRTP
jgi:hypothetical protein